MAATKRLSEELSGQIGRAMRYALEGGFRRHTPLALSIDHGLAALDPLSAPSLCEQIGRVLASIETPILSWWGLLAALQRERSWHARNRKRVLVFGTPELAPILTCDPDGHIREAAIRAWQPPAGSRFHLAMLVVRANDWVPEVRRAALQRLPEFWHAASAADRVCLSLLILDPERMGRIGAERTELETLIASPAAHEEMLEDLKQTDGRHSVHLISLLLRQPWIDPHLPSLAREAKTPLVKARALNALTTGRVKWRTRIREVWQGGTWGGRGERHPRHLYPETEAATPR